MNMLPHLRKTGKNRILFFLILCCLFAVCGCLAPTEPPQAPTATPPAERTPMPSPSVPPLTPTPLPENDPEVTEPAPSVTPTGTPGEVCFSESGYFLAGDTLLTLSLVSKKSGYITYTMNGREPSKASARYTEPLLLKANSGAFPNAYSIRAKAWYDDGSASDTYVHTYFVNTGIDSRYTTAIFSINGNPAELTDAPDGILYGTNYEARGRDSEQIGRAHV